MFEKGNKKVYDTLTNAKQIINLLARKIIKSQRNLIV